MDKVNPDSPAERAYMLIVGGQELTKEHAIRMFTLGVVCGKNSMVDLVLPPPEFNLIELKNNL